MEPKINQDIMFNLLLNSEIDNLKILYQTNKIANQICNNDFFWITKLSHNNIPIIYDEQPNNYIKWVKYYKDIQHTQLKIENIINIVLNEDFDIDYNILKVRVRDYEILHLLPIDHLLYNKLKNLDLKQSYQDLRIKILDDDQYYISYVVYYDMPNDNFYKDEFIFTITTTKKEILQFLTKILYFCPGINITDKNGDSYISKYLNKNIDNSFIVEDSSIRYKRLIKRLSNLII